MSKISLPSKPIRIDRRCVNAPVRLVSQHPKQPTMIVASWNDKIKPALQKAVSIQSNPTEESFPELPDVLVWVRAILALLYGCYAGRQPLVGGAVVFQALNLLTFVPYLYCTSRFLSQVLRCTLN